MAQVPSAPRSGTAAQRAAKQQVGHAASFRQQPRGRQGGGIPDWLIVILALAFVFVGLPILMPILWAIFLLTH